MHHTSTALPRSIEAPAQARRFCEAACQQWGLDALTDVCLLLVSELVTNAVVHGTGAVRLDLRAEGQSLHVSVCQADTVLELPEAKMNDNGAVSGRGLAIVGELAHRWGADVDQGGATVWFDLVNPPDGGRGGLG